MLQQIQLWLSNTSIKKVFFQLLAYYELRAIVVDNKGAIFTNAELALSNLSYQHDPAPGVQSS